MPAISTAAVGDVDYCIGEGTRTIDAEGAFITPGFIDGHIHPESSDLAIRPFAEAVLKHGTTSIMTDLHEVGVVSGLPGIEAVLEENEITDQLWEELEETLIMGDVGMLTAEELLAATRQRVYDENIKSSSDAYLVLKQEMVRMLRTDEPLHIDEPRGMLSQQCVARRRRAGPAGR